MEALPAEPDAATVRTLEVMARMVRDCAGSPIVRGQAVELARRVRASDPIELIGAIRGWLGEHVRFLNDPYWVETIADPQRMVSEIATRYYTVGDCDDVATLGAALGASLGLEPRFVVLGFHAENAPMSHVYAELLAPGFGWRELDTTRSVPENIRRSAISRTWTYQIYP